MNPMLHIRKVVLGISQAELAQIAGASQGTVSKWENGELEPDREQLSRVRDFALANGKAWDDVLVFEVPQPDASPHPAEAAS